MDYSEMLSSGKKEMLRSTLGFNSTTNLTNIVGSEAKIPTQIILKNFLGKDTSESLNAAEGAREIDNDLQDIDMYSLKEKTIPVLRSFVPERLVKIVTNKDKVVPTCESYECVVMLADVSGFTKLSEKLCSKGKSGVDELSEMMNEYFGEIIAMIMSHGGDIVNFAGDALLITWGSSQMPIEDQAIMASQCALNLAEVSKFGLSLHIGIATGLIHLVIIGGVSELFSCLMIGDPIVQMGIAESLAKAKQVVVCSRTLELICSRAELLVFRTRGNIDSDTCPECGARVRAPMLISNIVTENGRTRTSTAVCHSKDGVSKSHRLIQEENDRRKSKDTKSSSFDFRSSTKSESNAFADEEQQGIGRFFCNLCCPWGKSFARVLRITIPVTPTPLKIEDFDWDHELIAVSQHLKHFLPPAASTILHGGGSFMNELRRVSTIFLMLDGFSVGLNDAHTPPKEIMNVLQIALVSLQKILLKYQGMLRQFIIDDKGCVLIACFGLRGYKHGDDPIRAVRCALGLNITCNKLELEAYAGVTTGDAFCGAVGSVQRREYAMVGKNINLAARLMVLAKKIAKSHQTTRCVMCCGSTRSGCRSAEMLNFHAHGPEKLKGIPEPVIVYRASVRQQKSRLDRGKLKNLVARDRELTYIHELTEQFGGIRCLVRGGSGVGKSTLLEYALQCIQLSHGNKCVLKGRGNVLERTTTFFVFNQILVALVMVIESRELNAENFTISENVYDDVHSGESSIESRTKLEMKKKKHIKKFIDAFYQYDMVRTSEIEDKKEEEIRNVEETMENETSSGNCGEASDVNNSDSNGKPSNNKPTDEEYNKKRAIFDILKSSLGLTFRFSDLEYNSENCTNNGKPRSPSLDEFNFTTNLADYNKEMEQSAFVLAHMILFIHDIFLAPNNIELGFLIEDIHFIDASSSEALSIVLKAIGKTIFFLGTSLPQQNPLVDDLGLYDTVSSHIIDLKPMERSEIKSIIAQVFEVDCKDVDDEVADFVMCHGQGNPFMCTEIAKGLHHKRSDSLDPASYAVDSNPESGAHSILEATIISRFDRLPVKYQAILKSAAVVGMMFTYPNLHAILPRSITRKVNLKGILCELENQDWITVFQEEPTLTYIFQHDLLCQVLYDLNPKRQQKVLHLATCHAIIKSHDDDLRPYLSMLAFHYQKAGEDSSAFKYCLYSLKDDLNVGAWREALIHVNRMIDLDVSSIEMKSVLTEINQVIETSVLVMTRRFDVKRAQRRASGIQLGDVEAVDEKRSKGFLQEATQLKSKQDILMYLAGKVEERIKEIEEKESIMVKHKVTKHYNAVPTPSRRNKVFPFGKIDDISQKQCCDIQ